MISVPDVVMLKCLYSFTSTTFPVFISDQCSSDLADLELNSIFSNKQSSFISGICLVQWTVCSSQSINQSIRIRILHLSREEIVSQLLLVNIEVKNKNEDSSTTDVVEVM